MCGSWSVPSRLTGFRQIALLSNMTEPQHIACITSAQAQDASTALQIYPTATLTNDKNIIDFTAATNIYDHKLTDRTFATSTGATSDSHNSLTGLFGVSGRSNARPTSTDATVTS